MNYHDPRDHFPGRPTHPDFFDLADVVQGIDLRAEAGVPPLAIIHVDPESLLYFIQGRLSTMTTPTPLLMAVYADALAVGKGFASFRARRGEVPS